MIDVGPTVVDDDVAKGKPAKPETEGVDAALVVERLTGHAGEGGCAHRRRFRLADPMGRAPWNRSVGA